MTKDEALKLALEALEEAADAIDSWGSYASGYFQVKHDLESDISKAKSATTAIKEALAQPEREPVEVFLTDQHQMGFKVGVQSFILDYWPDEQAELEFMKTQLLTAFARATPPQRKPLTDEEIRKANHHMVDGAYDYSFKQGVKWAEYKHGIKGEA